MMRGIMFEFAAYESDVRGEQWRETHDHRRYKLHLPATGRRRFGYLWTPRTVPDPTAPGGIRIQEERYDAHPEQGPVMADRYRQYLEEAPFRALVVDLNEAGWRTVRGGLWSEQTLIRYMDSGFCAGLLRVHNPQCTCPSERRRNCTNFVFIPGAQEELIAPDLWQAYRERRAAQAAIPPRARTPVYPLSGLLRCGGCRGTVPAASATLGPAGDKRSVPGHAYHCGRRTSVGPAGCTGVHMRRADAERAVTAWLTREAAPAIDAAPAAPHTPAAAVDRRAQAAARREELQAEAARLAQALTTLRVQRAADPDDWGPGEYEAARDRIRERQAVVAAEMEGAAAVEALPVRADFQPQVVALAAEWGTYDYAQRNRILRRLIRRVVLTRGDGGVSVDVHPLWEADLWAQQPLTHV
jgi:site-specific DNA recombinase